MPDFCRLLKRNEGFTLLETLIVVVILSIMAMVVVPRITTFFNSQRENTAIATALIAKTFDDSFLQGNINYLTIHLYSPWSDELSASDGSDADILQRRNAMSVLRLKDGKLEYAEKNILKARDFPSSFQLDEVVLSSGEIIKDGNVLLPFYPAGYSDDVIIHVLINGSDRISIKIRKYLKEPQILTGYVNFDNAGDIGV